MDYQIWVGQMAISNPKAFYKVIASCTRSRGGISALLNNDKMTTNAFETASVLSSFYSSIYTVINTPGTAPVVRNIADPSFITVDSILRKLQRLNPNKSPGIDGIHPQFLRTCAQEISRLLLPIFQSSWTGGIVPSAWKTGVISPIYKGGDRLQACNYRPVTLLSTISKVFESIVDDDIRGQLTSQGYLHPAQHRFGESLTCTTNLVTAMNSWSTASESSLALMLYTLTCPRRLIRYHTVDCCK